MSDTTDQSGSPTSQIPADDPTRHLTVARPETDQSLPHLGVVGDTYTVLVSGQDTAGVYTLIDMLIPPGGGPPPHRHDFEELFSILEGEVEFTFRGEKLLAPAGTTINIPANAPHVFTNASQQPARLLCMCAPAGQEEFFASAGETLATRTTAPTPLEEAGQQAFLDKAVALMPKYKTELAPL